MAPKTTTFIAKFLADPESHLPKLTAHQIGAILSEATDAYHNTSKPIISDDMYDVLKARLVTLDPKHPFLNRVGAPPKEAVELPYFMGSLDKIKDDPRAIARFVAKYEGPFIVSDKLDGVSALLQVSGTTWSLYTRGDGTKGQNISHLLGFIKGIPVPPTKVQTSKIALRGELILSKDAWARLSHKGSNARNVVAGTVNAKHPDPEIMRELEYKVYSVYEPRMTPSDSLRYAQNMGFSVVYHSIVNAHTINVEDLTRSLVDRRVNSPFDVDGIVVMHNATHNIISGKNPKHAFAFKSILTHDEAEVLVSSVEWNASKDGYLKPLVHFEPVHLNGVNIRKATGFNAQFIEANAIGPGARIIIVRSGDVIPHILRVISPSFTKKGSFPQNVEYDWNETHVDIVLTHKENAADVQLKRLEHFVSHMDIKYLAKGTLGKLYAAGFTTIPNILALKESDMTNLDGFQSTGASKIVKSIADARAKATCEDYMVASNLFGRGFGKKTLKTLLDAFPEVREFEKPSASAANKIQGVGEKTISDFINALPEFFKFAKEIRLTCDLPKKTSESKTTSSVDEIKIKGKSFVFTGFRNKEWEAIIEAHGGSLGSSVSKKTTYVIAKDDSASNAKVQKARDQGVKIIREDEFLQYFTKSVA